MMMADIEVSHLTSDDDDDTSKDLMTFCMQLVHHSQWESGKWLICGSRMEIPNNHRLAKHIGVSYDHLDSDVLIYNSSRYAVHRSASLPETYTGDIIRIFTDDVHTGYVRLIREKDNTDVLTQGWYKIKDNQTIHGPAVKTNAAKRLTLPFDYSLRNDKAHKFESKEIQIASYDIVLAVHSPYWPVEATEWITRRRSHGFPSKSVIKQVVRYGCDIVQVSHNRLSNDGEWRFSFSWAELIIIKRWSISQRIVYSTLWVLNKKIASSNLCSYYFKTLMFWACEEKPTQFWNDDLLVYSVHELLIDMICWIKSKFCVNYFIPGNNMMDHLIDTNLSYEMGALSNVLQICQLIEEVLGISRSYELLSANTIYNIVCPAWIKRALVIRQRVDNDYDNYTDLFTTYVKSELQNALYVELSDIYRGLCFKQKSVSCVNESEKHIYLMKSESHLLLAVNLCKSQKRDIINDCGIPFLQSMLEYFHSHNTYSSSGEFINNSHLNINRRSTAERQNLLNDHNEQKCLLYSRSVEKHENKHVIYYSREKTNSGRNVTILLYATKDLNEPKLGDSNVKFYKEWPGLSPTVNISWFIAKAYLANLYYTTQRDVSLTIKTCDDIIAVYRQSQLNHKFSEKAFPVVLSTQWTSIYDKEIQELLGFYSLCSFVFDASSRSVYLGVCPVQFALYLKLRAVKDKWDSKPLVMDNRTFKEYLSNYLKHSDLCLCDQRVNRGFLPFTTFIVQNIAKSCKMTVICRPRASILTCTDLA